MKTGRVSLLVAGVAAALCTVSVARAEEPAKALHSNEMTSYKEVKATVTNIDQKTREVTLRKENGEEFSFVADEAVKNLPQVKKGDVVRVAYAEALAYEVRKGGMAADKGTVVGGAAAEPGKKPGGAMARETKATVVITAIDPKTPSVTIKGPHGNSETVKVLHPENLEGVSVGDTIDITYTEAVAVKVEEATK
jgi:Cu/Ag efflux protein CusF